MYICYIHVYVTMLLCSISRYGSVCEYLVSAGFTEEEQDKLRAIFLHPEETE